MPWSNRKYGRVICDACDWASKRKDLTGYKDVLTIGGYLRRKVDPERIYCPQCVLTHDDAAGGLTALHMTAELAQRELGLHWLPNEDLASEQDAGRGQQGEQDAGRGQQGQSSSDAAGRVDAGERDMEKDVMIERIRRLETTEELLSERVAFLEGKLDDILERLELLRHVVMEGVPDRAIVDATQPS